MFLPRSLKILKIQELDLDFCLFYVDLQNLIAKNMASSCTGIVSDIEDIEDIVSPVDTSFQVSGKSESRVLPRALRKKKQSALESQSVCDSFIPGRHLIYIKTWGCTHNTSDGEYMAGLLAASGYFIVGAFRCV